MIKSYLGLGVLGMVLSACLAAITRYPCAAKSGLKQQVRASPQAGAAPQFDLARNIPKVHRYGPQCNRCRLFPTFYEDDLLATTDHCIDFFNLTTNGGTAQDLLESIKTSQTTREAVKSADIIGIATGKNDLEAPFVVYAASVCHGADNLDCFRKAAEGRRDALDGILTEIESLRNGRPTAGRLVTTSNEFLSDPDLIERFRGGLREDRGRCDHPDDCDVECEVAAKHNARCVDLGLALNWPDLLGPQDVNTQEAKQAAADALLASGLDELPSGLNSWEEGWDGRLYYLSHPVF